jgi:ribonuclease-3
MKRREAAIAVLEERLGHVFADRALLQRALTHASVRSLGRAVEHNERLEFLGDRVLALLIAERLLELQPGEAEGQLSKRLNSLVDRASCARVARALEMPSALLTVGGSTHRESTASDTILGDACEALLAAVYLDAGLDKAREVVRRLWDEALITAPPVSANPKAALQEWLASLKRGLPTYEIIERSGPPHAPMFTVRVNAEGLEPGIARGRSRQEAEKAAALAVLRREGRAE